MYGHYMGNSLRALWAPANMYLKVKLEQHIRFLSMTLTIQVALKFGSMRSSTRANLGQSNGLGGTVPEIALGRNVTASALLQAAAVAFGNAHLRVASPWFGCFIPSHASCKAQGRRLTIPSKYIFTNELMEGIGTE